MDLYNIASVPNTVHDYRKAWSQYMGVISFEVFEL